MAEEINLGDVCKLIVDCEHKTAPAANPGAEYGYAVGTPHIRNGRILLDQAKPVDGATYKKWTSREVPKSGDLVLAREAPVGQVGRIRSGDRVCLGQRTVLLRPDPDAVDSKFLHYLLLSPLMQEKMGSKAAGSTVPHLNVKDIRSFPIPTPPDRATQNHIGNLLSALDDKIAANERIADTSRRLVATIFEGLLMESNQSHGWSDVSLDSVAGINTRKISPSPGGWLRYIDIASVSPGKFNWPDLASWDDAPSRARRGVSRGDVLWSTVRPNRRSHALVLEDDPALVASTGFAVLTPRTVGYAYLYAVTSRDEFVDYLVSVAEGSAYPAVRADRFKQAIIPLPPKEILDRFETKAATILDRAHTAKVESRTLAALRDTLLPKLISGELRVKDAEREVSDAV